GRGRSLAAGFFSKGTHEVVDSPFCDTLAGPINEVKEWIRGLLVKHHVSIYDETRHLGFLRGLVVRHAEQTGQTLVGLVTMRGVFKKRFLPDLTQARELKRFGIVGILQNFNSQKTNVLLGPKSRPLWGRDYLVEELDGLKFRVSLGSFFQVNAAQAKNLYAIIEDWTKGDGGLVVDAYCGSGGISLWLARAGRRVLGIDECAPAVADARSSAEWNGLAGCRFLAGTLETRLKDLEAEPAIDTLIVDPPRKGLSAEVIAAIPRLRPGKLVYVSCNPATLARDLAQLPGYAIRDLRVVDMFPQTQHVETAALLERC
ncbi:MAG: 23S rRNA (uracil(1939)-C(5))-methyltransferase RlmD, partial [Nitrospinaceae bacterium]